VGFGQGSAGRCAAWFDKGLVTAARAVERHPETRGGVVVGQNHRLLRRPDTPGATASAPRVHVAPPRRLYRTAPNVGLPLHKHRLPAGRVKDHMRRPFSPLSAPPTSSSSSGSSRAECSVGPGFLRHSPPGPPLGSSIAGRRLCAGNERTAKARPNDLRRRRRFTVPPPSALPDRVARAASGASVASTRLWKSAEVGGAGRSAFNCERIPAILQRRSVTT